MLSEVLLKSQYYHDYTVTRLIAQIPPARRNVVSPYLPPASLTGGMWSAGTVTHDFASALTTVRWEAQNMLLWERGRESLDRRATCETTQGNNAYCGAWPRRGSPDRFPEQSWRAVHRCLGEARARLFYGLMISCGCSYVFHLSGDNSWNRCVKGS